MEYGNIGLAGIIQVLGLGQKIAYRLVKTQIALFNSNAGQGSHYTLGGGFQVVGFCAGPFPEIPFNHHVIIADNNDTVDAFQIADVSNSCFKFDRVKTQERRR